MTFLYGRRGRGPPSETLKATPPDWLPVMPASSRDTTYSKHCIDFPTFVPGIQFAPLPYQIVVNTGGMVLCCVTLVQPRDVQTGTAQGLGVKGNELCCQAKGRARAMACRPNGKGVVRALNRNSALLRNTTPP